MRSIRTTALRGPGWRISTVALGAVAVLGIVAAPAQASSWSSKLVGAAPGFESRHYADDGGPTNVKFTNCKDDYSNSRVNIVLRKDTLGPDPYYSTHTYTACFTGGTSSGNWDDHGSGTYYWAVNDGLVNVHVWADPVATYY
ncbi:hypothetical protein ACIBBE_20055 [Streptomyces sp. NPDC051644]|uniref:hypothetical protein n=1 Tax=Streptomyces sp. NPDC051644 TaxID=3365666 RepID=UPI003787B475